LARRGIVSTAAAIAAGCVAQANQAVPLGLAAKTLSSVATYVPAVTAGGAGLVSVIVAAGWKWAIAASLLAIGSVAVIEHRTLSRIAGPLPVSESAPVGSSPSPAPAEAADTRPPAAPQLPGSLNRRVQRPPTAEAEGLSDEQLEQVLRTSPVVIGQVGEVYRVRRLSSQHKVMRRRLTGEAVGYSGNYRYQVDGAHLSQRFQIDWERIPADGPTRITQVAPSTATREPGLPGGLGGAQLPP
jgi:hypothetical protein